MEDLKALLQLQSLDLRVERCHSQEKKIPLQKEKYKEHLQRLDAELAQSEQRVKDLQVEQRECEGSIEDKKALIAKYEVQLLAVKKNEEYQALLKEIETVTKQISAKEERVIGILLEIDDSRECHQEDEKRIAEEKAEIDQECTKIDEELQEAITVRQKLEKDQKPLLEQVEKKLYNQYQRIRKSKGGGKALVGMQNEACSGCFMVLRPQMINEILAGKEIHTCRNCGRMLYNPDHPEADILEA